MLSTDPPIELSFHFDTELDTLWKSITELELMRQWFFAEIPSFKAEVGFETTFDVKGENNVFPHHWIITEVSAPHKIVFNWNYPGYRGDATMVFNIEEKEDECTLHLRMEAIESFESEKYPEFKRESCVGGWNYFMERLGSLLSN